MQHNLPYSYLFAQPYLLLTQEVCFAVLFAEAHDTVKPLLEGVVMADDDELLKAAHTANLLGQIGAPQFVHILRRLIEEGNIQVGELLEQRQANRQRRAHLLATAQLREGAIDTLTAQRDLVIVLPRELRAAVAHDLAEDAVSLRRDIVQHSLQYVWGSLFDEGAEQVGHGVQIIQRLVFSLRGLKLHP